MSEFTKHKEILQAEMKELQTELSRLGIQNPNDPAGWTLKNPAIDVMQADKNEAADKNEELHVNSIILDELAVRYKNVERAIKKLEEGAYGVCEVDGGKIEEDRLLANPAARTCKQHITETEKLDD